MKRIDHSPSLVLELSLICPMMFVLCFVMIIGDLICAQFSQDRNWYRAQCINAFCPKSPETVPNYNNSLPIEIMYIDYGNSEWVPLSR